MTNIFFQLHTKGYSYIDALVEDPEDLRGISSSKLYRNVIVRPLTGLNSTGLRYSTEYSSSSSNLVPKKWNCYTTLTASLIPILNNFTNDKSNLDLVGLSPAPQIKILLNIFFRGSVYDAVVMVGCGGFGNHPSRVLDELLRITKPGTSDN